jgi:hypothetical protein
MARRKARVEQDMENADRVQMSSVRALASNNKAVRARSDAERPASPLNGGAAGRVKSIDYAKGFAMLWIFWAHLGAYWNDGSWNSLWRLVYAFMDWLGPCFFVAITTIGTMLSFYSKGVTKPTRAMWIDAGKKFVYMLTIGEIMNVVIDVRNPYHLGAWILIGMNMMVAIAFAQPFTLLLVQLSIRYRVLLLCILTALFPVLFSYCASGWIMAPDGLPIASASASFSNLTTLPMIIYYIFFYMEDMIPVYGWIMVCVLVSIVFDHVIRQHLDDQAKLRVDPSLQPMITKARLAAANRLIIIGIAIAGITFLAGGFVLTKGIGSVVGPYLDLTDGDAFSFWRLPGVPLILIHGLPPYWFYNIGIFTAFFGVLYRIEFSRPNRPLPTGWAAVEVFGRFSFSTFVYSYAYALIPLRINFWVFLPLYLGLDALMVVGTWYWERRGKNILSLEWGLKKYMNALAYLERRIKKREAPIVSRVP